MNTAFRSGFLKTAGPVRSLMLGAGGLGLGAGALAYSSLTPSDRALLGSSLHDAWDRKVHEVARAAADHVVAAPDTASEALMDLRRQNPFNPENLGE